MQKLIGKLNVFQTSREFSYDLIVLGWFYVAVIEFMFLNESGTNEKKLLEITFFSLSHFKKYKGLSKMFA